MYIYIYVYVDIYIYIVIFPCEISEIDQIFTCLYIIIYVYIYISYTGKCLEIATSTRIAHYFWKDAFDWFFRISFRFSDLIIDG